MAVARRKCKGPCGLNRALKFFPSQNARICTPCQKARVSDSNHARHIEQTHGITADEYRALDDAQEGCCYICGRKPTYRKQVDHDHEVERNLIELGYAPRLAHRMSIRGLLCKMCNKRLLPAAQDRPEWLRRAIRYLTDWPANNVLKRLEDVQ